MHTTASKYKTPKYGTTKYEINNILVLLTPPINRTT